jgi:tetratricopeptide (TPR) repeat protein
MISCLLALNESADLAAEQPQTKGRSPALTAEQRARLRERDGLAREAEELRDQGKYKEAVAAAAKALALTRAVRGREHAEVARVLEWLAELSEQAGDFEQAVGHRQEVLTLRQKLDGDKHWGTADARLALAFTRRAAGLGAGARGKLVAALRKEQEAERLEAEDKYAAAERVALGVLETYRAAVGDETAAVARVWQLVGQARLAREDARGAKEAFERVLAIRRKVLPADHPDLVMSLDTLGLVQHALRENAAARKSHEEALAICRKALPADHPNIAHGLNNLGNVQHALGEHAAARKSHEEALAIYRKARPKNHPDIADSLNNLGNAQHALRDYAAARRSFAEALAIFRKNLPEGHRYIAASLNNLGNVQHALGEYAAAQKSHEEALAIYRKARPKDDLAIAESLTNLGNAQHALRENAAARKGLEEALAIYRKALPKDHPDIATSLDILGDVQRDLRDYVAARKSFEEALAIWRKLLPAGHPHIAGSLNDKLAIERQLFGNMHEEVANSLQLFARMQEAGEDFAAARKALQEVLTIKRKLHGREHWKVTDARLALDDLERRTRMTPAQRQRLGEAERLHGEAAALHRGGRFREAVRADRQALAIYKEVLGEKHPLYAASLNNLAELYREMVDHARAEPLYRQALAIWKEALGEKHPLYATSLNNLALLYQAMGDYARAEPLCRQSLAIRKEALGEKHNQYATSLNNLALLYFTMGDHAKAEPLFRQALAIRKEALGEKRTDYDYYVILADYGTSLNNLAELYRRMGDYAKAEPLYRQLLVVDKHTLGETHPHYATDLNNLAMLYEGMGDYAKAEPILRQALAIIKEALGEKHPLYAASLNNLAELYRKMENYARAEPLYRQALAILKEARREKHPDYATILGNLAVLLDNMGDYAKAEPLCRQALAIIKEALGEKHPHYATSLNNLAGLYEAMGNHAEAEPLYLQALAIHKEALGEKHPDYATCLHNLALLYQEMGDYAQAERFLRQGLEISRDNLDLAAAVQSERQQLAMASHLRCTLDAYLDLAPRAKHGGEPAYRPVLAWKGAVFARQRRFRLQRRHPELADAFAQLESMASRLATLAFAVPDPEQQATFRRQIEELTEEKERLESDLARRSAAYRQQRQAERLEPERLQAALRADTALVDFLEYTHRSPPPQGKGQWRFERRLAAFVVRRDSLQQLDLGLAQPIAEHIGRWRASHAVGKAPPEGMADPAAQLRKQLWLPLERHLKGIKVVLVSPDGALNGLPLAALPGAEPGKFLVHEYAFATVAVPQLLPELLQGMSRPAQEPPSLLLAGGIDFGESKAEPPAGSLPPVPLFSRLAGSESEVNDLRAQFEDAFPDAPAPKLLRKDKATKAAFLAAAPRHRFVHLATHGFFAAESEKSALAPERRAALLRDGLRMRVEATGRHPGLLSGVVFAGVNRPEHRPEESILTALEGAELGLDQVELVVLSACETGRGQVAGGEGVLGLQRAFQLAGARGVVASLWRVSDEETHQLMREFYRRVWSDKPLAKAEALRQAQLWMLDNWKPRGGLERPAPKGPPPPYVWAAFVLSGDWR